MNSGQRMSLATHFISMLTNNSLFLHSINIIKFKILYSIDPRESYQKPTSVVGALGVSLQCLSCHHDFCPAITMALRRGQDGSSETRREEARVKERPVGPSRNVIDRPSTNACMVGRLGSAENVTGEVGP
jgi:hypothetical protein